MSAKYASPHPSLGGLISSFSRNLCDSSVRIFVTLCFAWVVTPYSDAAFVSYAVTAEEGDSWSGVIEVTDLNTPIASPGNPVQNNTWVSVSASGFGSFPANYSDGQWFGNPPNGAGGFGYSNNNDGLYFISSSLYSAVFGNSKTWNDLITDGPFGIAAAGVFGFAASFNNSTGNLQALTSGTVTFSAVPEPSTYAMALTALACGGYALRRRRKRLGLVDPSTGDCKSRLIATCWMLLALVFCVGSRDAAGSEIYLTSYFNGTVGKFAADGTPINTSLITGLSNPSGIKLGPDGFLYVANRGSGVVGRYSTAGTGNATFLTGLSAPFGIAFDGSGDMYVASYQSSNSVRKYSANGSPLNMTYITGLPKAEGLAFDPAGNLYVSDFQLGTVSKYGPTGTLIDANFITGLSGPTALAIDANSNLFVSQYSSGRVGKYTASTSSFNSSFISGYAEPEGIVVNSDGSLLVASLAGGRVQKYDASGTLVNANFITGVGSAYAMTGPALFTPAVVPEPSTYVMALAGLAFGGFSMWRRRR